MMAQHVTGWSLLAGKGNDPAQNPNINLSEEIANSISEMKQERNSIIFGQNTKQAPTEIYRRQADPKSPKKSGSKEKIKDK